jgi:polyphosphate kinase 2
LAILRRDEEGERMGKKQDKLGRKEYEKALAELQVELCAVQDWIKQSGQRAIIVFEGRDAAGKGGTIKAITERVSPRVFRVVALPPPSDRQKSQLYMQRYIEQFPAGGEIVIFDRSWYNRAGVEHVMGFCSPEQHKHFLENCPVVEKFIVEGGTHLIKIWLEVGQEEQDRRFRARVEDPVRQWKLSPMDIESFTRWNDYSRARDMMFEHTDTDFAPWHVVDSNDKKRARLNIIAHILSRLPYERVKRSKVKLPGRPAEKHERESESLAKRRYVEARY